MEKILVTGANGMLASNIIEQLARQDYTVIGTVRTGRSYPGVVTKNIRIAEADFKDADAMEELIAGCDAVLHAAAMTSQSCRDYSEYRRVNAEATRMLAGLAAAHSVKTFVYVSTANTIGFGGDESREMVYPFTESYYARSKKEAEDAVLPYRDRMRVVIVNPTFMIGKYGSAQGSNRVFSMVRKSPAVFYPSGGKNVLDVGEAAKGIILAMQRGRNGEKYLICGKNYSYRELFRLLSARLDVRRLYIPIPDFALRLAGYAGELASRAGIATELTRVNMDILTVDNFYTTDKAHWDLGFNPQEEILQIG